MVKIFGNFIKTTFAPLDSLLLIQFAFHIIWIISPTTKLYVVKYDRKTVGTLV